MKINQIHTVASYSSSSPKPLSVYMISKWNLLEKHREMLDLYKLAEVDAAALNLELIQQKGVITLHGVPYAPVYQQCSRDHIRANAHKGSGVSYWLSFRKTKDLAVVLIQPKK